MTDFIEREDVLSLKKPFPNQKGMITLYRQYFINPEAVEQLPAADVRPVVRGRWVEHIEHDEETDCDVPYGFECSECGRWEQYKEPFCNCGADMRTREELESLNYIPPWERSGVDDG